MESKVLPFKRILHYLTVIRIHSCFSGKLQDLDKENVPIENAMLELDTISGMVAVYSVAMFSL